MSQRDRAVAGIGGIAFTVLFAAGALLAETPGGTYDEKAIADYLAEGHQSSVALALILALLGVLGLLMLLVGLRDKLSKGSLSANVFAATGLVSVTAFAIGWAVWLEVPLSKWIGGSDVVINAKISYVILQVGAVIVFGVGGTFLGVTLIVLMLGSLGRLPSWFRWFTLVVGVLALASMAWLPFFPLLLWGLVAGVWLIAGARGSGTGGEAQASV